MQGQPLDAPAADESADDIPAIGARVAGRYVVEEVIGTGGMSVVTRARDLRLEAPVALKFLRRSRAVRGAQLARFVREARIVARLQSDHVVRILDVDAGHDPPYLVMELAPEGDVGRMLRENGRLPVPLATEILLQACRGVADTHAIDIVHRDLKPSNLLIARTSDGGLRIKVADFGVSKMMADETSPDLTFSGQIVGSPRYMSPEQVRGGGKVDTRSDVWALGAILYELLSGEAPFGAQTVPDTLARIVSEVPAPLEYRGLPRRLSAVVALCLQKDPALRPTVKALAEELAAVAGAYARPAIDAESTADSGVEGPWGRPPAPPKERRALGRVGLAATAAAVFALGLAMGGLRASRPPSDVPVRAVEAPLPSSLNVTAPPPVTSAVMAAVSDPPAAPAPAPPPKAPNVFVVPAASVSAPARPRPRPSAAVVPPSAVDDLQLDKHE